MSDGFRYPEEEVFRLKTFSSSIRRLRQASIHSSQMQTDGELAISRRTSSCRLWQKEHRKTMPSLLFLRTM